MLFGGIVGRNDQKSGSSQSIIERCYNSGTVDGIIHVGGIIGVTFNPTGEMTVKECYNKGEPGDGEYDGSIIGKEDAPDKTGIFNHLYYLNTLNTPAINGKEDDSTTNKIMGVSDDIASFEDFITWIESKVN